jgi:uncharacterized protein YqeY
MNIADKINEDIKLAMKAQAKDKLSALRDIKAKLLLEMTKEGGSGEVADSVALKILDKLYKQRIEAATIYKEQGRENLWKEEMDQADVIKAYLPEAASEEEIRKVIQTVIAETGAASPSDMGKVMTGATQKLAGRADGKTISGLVKQLLSGQ